MLCFRRITASVPRLILMVAVVLAGLTLDGCGGSPNGQTVSVPPVPLPPAIPATVPVLLFNGTGTSAPDVSAIQAVLGNLDVSYETADSVRLNALSKQQLGGYKLIIIPGGNSITIGQSLSSETASNLRIAVQQYGVHYLGICAGAFFGAYSIYNGIDLTGGVSFDFYADELKGIHKEPVTISFPSSPRLDVYWEDGPQLFGWGSVVAKFPDGSPAIVQGESGKGFVIFTGVHLEAPESWRGSMSFATPTSVDLAYAGTLFNAVLSGTQLPHF